MSQITLFTLALFFVSSFNSYAENSKDTLVQMIEENKGKVIYIDFWASWCTPCRKSFPWMNEIQKKYENLKVISINVDAERSYAKEFLAEVPANFSVIYDPNGEIAKQYKLKGMPSSYVLNKQGKLVSTHVGFNKNKQIAYQQELEQLLIE